MELIRYYNQKSSFVSFNANFVDQFKRGIYNLKIQGQVCHTIFNSLNGKNEKLDIGRKIFLYDNQEIIHLLITENPKIIENYVQITQVLRKLNPYASKYKQLYEISEQMQEYKLYFLRNANKSPKTYNKPLTAECAALIESKDGECKIL